MNRIGSANNTLRYTYDAANRLTGTLSWNGQLTAYAFDKAGRLITTTLPNGLRTVNTYDDANRVIRLAHSRTSDGTLAGYYQFALDDVGNRLLVTETTLLPDGYAPPVNLAVNPGFELGSGAWPDNWSQEKPSGSSATFAWVTGTLHSGARSIAIYNTTSWALSGNTKVAYDPAKIYTGRAWVKTAMSAGTAGVKVEFFGASQNWLGQVQVTKPFRQADWTPVTASAAPGTAPTGTAYIRVSVIALQITGTAWFDDATLDNGSVVRYTYDPLYRLTNANYSGAYTYTFTYGYDAVGNRTVQTRTITNTQVTVYQYDTANRLTNAGGVANTWDNNGNLINDGSATYLYDRANRMISTTVGGVTSLYTYNGDGARLRQIIAGVPTTYTQDLVAPLPVVVQAKTGSVTMQYLYALGTRPVAENGGAWQYFLPDALGSVRQIVDANGNVTLAKSYEPYGTVLTSTGTASSIFGYAGEQADTTGLIYLRARYMNPRLGIFLARDPWSGDVLRPGSMNGWNYAEGEPVNHTDPSGQWALDLSYPKVYLVAEAGDTWDTFLAGFYGKEVNVATLSSWLHLNLRLPSSLHTGDKVNITSALDPLIVKTAEFGEGMEKRNRYYPPDVESFNCYPTALTCAAGKCQYHEYMYYDIDDFLRDNSRNIAHEDDLRYGDIFRIGGDDGGKSEDGGPAFYNAPIHYGMILWRSGTTGKIWTFNGQITSYAFIAVLPEVLAYYRTEYPERNIIGVPKPGNIRGDLDPMHLTGFYRLNIGVSAAQIVQWIDDPNKTPSSK